MSENEVIMALKKPKSIAENEYKTQKWDELTQGRKFSQSDIPALELLCSWHAIAQKCMSDLDTSDGIEVAYANDIGDVKALPQIATLKQASAEIRQLNKQLCINDVAKENIETKQLFKAIRSKANVNRTQKERRQSAS